MKKKELLKNTIIIFIGRISTRLISFFLLPLYTGYLSTSEYGLVDLITSYVTLIVPIITLESEMSIFRYLIDDRKKGNNDTSNLITNNFIIFGISSLIFSILYAIFTSFVTIPFRWIVLLCVLACVLSGNLLQIARGMGKTVKYSVASIIAGVVTILSNIFFIVYMKSGASGMILSMMIANFICSIYLIFSLKLYKYIKFNLFDNKLIKSMFKYSIPLVPNGVSWWVINISDRTIITFILGKAFNGIYAVSNKFPTIISSLLGIFNLSWSESSALHIDDKDRDIFFSEITNKSLKIFSSMGAMMLVIMPFIFPFFVNSKFGDSYNYIPILTISCVFNVLVCIYTGIYIARKETKKVASTTIIGALVNILINVVLIKYIGLYAAAISTALSYLVMAMVRHFDIVKSINIKFDKYLIEGLIIEYIFIFSLYYINNRYLNILSLVIVSILSIIINRDSIKEIVGGINEKVKIQEK